MLLIGKASNIRRSVWLPQHRFSCVCYFFEVL